MLHLFVRPLVKRFASLGSAWKDKSKGERQARTLLLARDKRDLFWRRSAARQVRSRSALGLPTQKILSHKTRTIFPCHILDCKAQTSSLVYDLAPMTRADGPPRRSRNLFL